MMTFTVLMAWVPRHPEQPKYIYPRLNIDAVSATEATIRAYETHRETVCPFSDEEVEHITNQMLETDYAWLDVYYADLEIEGKGTYQFAVWDKNETNLSHD